MSFEFNATRYTTKSRYLQAIAQSWLTADGLNDSETINGWLDEFKPGAIAQECLDGWFSCVDDETERPDLDGLTAAFADLAKDREWLGTVD